MEKWFIKIKNKSNNERITIYTNGLVYGSHKGQKLFNLNNYTMEEIKEFLNYNIYSLIKYKNTDCGENNYILRLQSPNKGHEIINIEGWYLTPTLINMISDKDRWDKVYLRVADNN